MSKISEYGERVAAQYAELSTGIDGISSDVGVLNDLITKLQNSAGEVTPEDQAILDNLEAGLIALKDRVKAVDDLTAAPPVVPPTE